MENTARQIVFIVCLLGFFFTLMMTMPGEFYIIAPDYTETEYPDYWDIGDIQTVKYHDDETVFYQVAFQYFEIPRPGDTIYVRLQWYYDAFLGENAFDFQHHNWGFLGLFYGNIEPYPLPQSVVNASVDESGNFSRFLMTCDHHNYIVYIGNDGNYTNLSDALDDGQVGVSIGVDYDYEESGLSGWDLITRLLTFQLPNVTPEISFLIGIPIYTLIGVLAFILFTMIVEMFPTT